MLYIFHTVNPRGSNPARKWISLILMRNKLAREVMQVYNDT